MSFCRTDHLYATAQFSIRNCRNGFRNYSFLAKHPNKIGPAFQPKRLSYPYEDIAIKLDDYFFNTMTYLVGIFFL